MIVRLLVKIKKKLLKKQKKLQIIEDLFYGKIMTFIEFKKYLLALEITIPKFSKLLKLSEKNIQAYKKKEEFPNTIATIVSC